MNAAECLLEVGDAAAVALECGAKRVTYAELREAVPRAAAAWQGLGLTKGERVVVFAPDSDDWVRAYLGAIWAGGVAIGVNPHLPLADLGPILADSEVRYVWCEPELAGPLDALAQSLPDAPAIVAAGGGAGRDWTSALAGAAPVAPVQCDDEDPGLWIGTSGTTGIPKGVIHPQRVAVQPHSFAAGVLGASAADRFYSTSKLFFAYALGNSLFAGLRLGATVILDRERATPQRTREMVARHRPTLLFTVPTLYSKMLHEGVAPWIAGAGIRHFVSAGEALPTIVRDSWRRAAGTAPISGYGTSETLCLALYGDDDSGLLRPTPLTSVRCDDIDAAIPQRVWLRNPTTALGYWRRPEAQADGFRDGWFSPGDLFIRHDGGRLEFTGRQDDMLKVSGQWVSTIWVEHALAEAGGDAVDHVAAVGVPTPDGLTAIAALAVAVPGRERDARERLQAGIARLPKYRRPQWVHWVSALPLTATGKLQRSRLRAAHEAALGSASGPRGESEPSSAR
jgi:acyl-coenzyme A synthetase/AMP-(fatty) acid ligase